MKRVTAEQLIAALKRFPKKTQIFMSSDTEGNSYSTIDVSSQLLGFGYSAEDNAAVIYPYEEYLTDEQVMPIQNARIIAELKAEGKIK